MLFGGIARRLAFAHSADAPALVNSVMGLGSGFSRTTIAARLRRRPLGLALRLVAGGSGGWTVVQNPEDRAALAELGIDVGRIALIRGSGVDISRFVPLPEPGGDAVAVALVSRMLRDKGVLDAAAAIRRLRAQGLAIELLLAGPTDPDNANSLTPEVLRSLTAEPGIEWLGPVADVRTVWRRAAIAVLPSTYGEGVPKTLLEAAACGRPLVAADVPGCREVVHPDETGILVPPHDVDRLAEAIAALAGDPARRARTGSGRQEIDRMPVHRRDCRARDARPLSHRPRRTSSFPGFAGKTGKKIAVGYKIDLIIISYQIFTNPVPVRRTGNSDPAIREPKRLTAK